MLPGPVVEAKPCEQIPNSGCGEKADRDKKADRLEDARVSGHAFEYLAVKDRDNQHEPRRHREDHGSAAERHCPVPGKTRNGRDRIPVVVGAPLAAGVVVVAIPAQEAHQSPPVPTLAEVGSPGYLKSGCQGVPGSAGRSSRG